MSSSIFYKELFEVRILHHYFLDNGEQSWDPKNEEDTRRMEAHYDVREFFEITPTAECRDILNSYNCIFRITATGILVGIKAEPDEAHPGKFKPFKSPDDDVAFRFLVHLRDVNFMNYTALPLQGREVKMFIFKNFTAAGCIKSPSLTAVPPVYDPDAVYYPGDMLCDDQALQAKLYTALVKTSGDPEVPASAGDWFKETTGLATPMNYANAGDLYPVVNGLFSYTMKVTDTNPIATLSTFAGVPLSPQMEVQPGTYKTLQVDLKTFTPGFYRLHVEGDKPGYLDEVIFYLTNQAEPTFGLIEICVKSDVNDFNLTDTGYLLSPAFELRFRNRRTWWRYLGSFTGSPFEVDHPVPLTRSGFISFEQPFYPTKLPNPSGGLIIPEALIKPGEKKYYSDIHIN